MREHDPAVRFALILSIGLSSATAAQAQVDDPISRARALLQEFEYEAAERLVQERLGEPLSPAVELALRALLVEVHASRGDEGAATAAATELYRRDPGYPVPSEEEMSPRIRAFFVPAAEAAERIGPAAIEVGVGEAPERLELSLRTVTTALIDRVEVAARAEGGSWAVASGTPDADGFVASIERAERVEYHVTMRAPSGRVVALAGSEQTPLTWYAPATSPEPAPAPPAPLAIDEAGPVVDEPTPGPRWWLIGAGGGAVIVATIALVLALARPWSQGASLDDTIQVP